jgi:hypothetical protein
MLAGIALSTLTACASAEPPGVVRVGSRNLNCPRAEIETMLNRETPKVREYLVGCNFMYTRVHCTSDGCYAAKPEPPCFDGMPCFKEDPVTLQWVLDEPVHLSGPL